MAIRSSSAAARSGRDAPRRCRMTLRCGIDTSASEAHAHDGNSVHTGEAMNAIRIVGAVLIGAGVVALAVGGFSYTRETHSAKLGPIELTMKEKETVNIP